MEPRLPESEIRIFDGQRMILEDEEFVGRIRNNIANGETAERAVLRVIEELSAAMRAVADDYLRERVADFREVGHSVLRHLRKEEKRGPIQ
jgi:signal transduction protein with GAF and PtsI domain